jgi:lipopolysaccharide transport system permease protein
MAITQSRSINRFVHMRDLLRELVARDMKLRYKRSILGFGWSLLNPLAQLLVFRFIFEEVLPAGVPNFTSFLFSGLLVWNWFNASLMMATTSVVDNRDLIRRPGFPTAILPPVVLVSHLLHFLIALPILIAFLTLNGTPISGAVVALPALIAIQFTLTLGLAYVLAAVHVAFRDTQYLLGVALLLLMFLSGIFYDAASIPPRYHGLILVNPMVRLVAAYRRVLIDGRFPDGEIVFSLAIIAVTLVASGYFVFKRASYRFVEEL